MTAFLFLGGCTVTPTQTAIIPIVIIVDGKQLPVDVPPGSSVQAALETAGITLDALDKVSPSAGTAWLIYSDNNHPCP